MQGATAKCSRVNFKARPNIQTHTLVICMNKRKRKDHTGYKPLSYGDVLERTGFEHIETTIRKHQLGFAGSLIQQSD